jgi:hypothetical protein
LDALFSHVLIDEMLPAHHTSTSTSKLNITDELIGIRTDIAFMQMLLDTNACMNSVCNTGIAQVAETKLNVDMNEVRLFV